MKTCPKTLTGTTHDTRCCEEDSPRQTERGASEANRVKTTLSAARPGGQFGNCGTVPGPGCLRSGVEVFWN